MSNMPQRVEPIVPYRMWDPSQVFELDPPEWLMEYVLPKAGSVLLYGPTNVGKSLVALDWAFRLAIGHRWLGLKVPEPQRVMYVYAEAGHDLQLRYQAWIEGNDIQNFQNLDKNLRFLGLDEEVNLRWDPDNPDFPPVGVERLFAAADEFKPEVIMFDPAQEVWRGMEENQSRHVAMAWRVVKDLRRKYNCAAVIIHHSRKDDTTFRGATTWLDLADIGFSITESSTDAILDLKNTKSRFAKKGRAWKLERRVQDLRKVPKLLGQQSVYIARGLKADEHMKERDVLAFLSLEPKGFGELSMALYGRKDASACARLLSKMQAGGMIGKDEGRLGKYKLIDLAQKPKVI